MERKVSFKQIVAAALVGASLTGCASGLSKGDHIIAKEPVKLVTDYNASTISKPSCTIGTGVQAEITDFSTLHNGSSDQNALIALTSPNCSGWAIDNLELRNKVEKINNKSN